MPFDASNYRKPPRGWRGSTVWELLCYGLPWPITQFTRILRNVRTKTEDKSETGITLAGLYFYGLFAGSFLCLLLPLQAVNEDSLGLVFGLLSIFPYLIGIQATIDGKRS